MSTESDKKYCETKKRLQEGSDKVKQKVKKDIVVACQGIMNRVDNLADIMARPDSAEADLSVEIVINPSQQIPEVTYRINYVAIDEDLFLKE